MIDGLPQIAGVINLKEISIPGSGIGAHLTISEGSIGSSAMPKWYDVEKIDVVSSLWVGGNVELKLKLHSDPQMQIDWQKSIGETVFWDWFTCSGETTKEILKDCLITIIGHEMSMNSSQFTMSTKVFENLEKESGIEHTKLSSFCGVDLRTDTSLPDDKIIFMNDRQGAIKFTVVGKDEK